MRSVWLIISALIAIGQCEASSEFSAINDLKDAINDLPKLCISNEDCVKYAFKNYCCSGSCCNMLQYLFRNGNWWDNFVVTFKSPRPSNLLFDGLLLILCTALVFGFLFVFAMITWFVYRLCRKSFK